MTLAPIDAAFLAVCPLPEDSHSELGKRLAGLLESARRTHAHLDVSDSVFGAALGRAVEGEEAPLPALEALRADDLYLAVGCASGDATSIAYLEREQLGGARGALLRLLGATDADDGLQTLRMKLLVGRDGAPPKIAEYAGRGNLAGWIKVVAVRIALSVLRTKRPEWDADTDDALLELPLPASGEPDPMRARYGAAFKSAFQAALAALSPRERLLLRLQFVDDLSVDRIGALYGVHRATAARWVARARDSLFDGTTKRLAAALGLAEEQLSSIIDAVRSHVDVSLLRVLGEEPSAARANATSA
jgi:RNA polymerase sigma-70 factor (ECF subfamily)